MTSAPRIEVIGLAAVVDTPRPTTAVVNLDGPSAVLASTLLAFLLVPAGIVAGVAFDARAAARAFPQGVRP